MTDHPNSNRRTFLKQAAGAAILCLGGSRAISAETTQPPHSIIAFIKFLQSLSYDKLATVIAELGFDGIEATVRRGGYVLPERVEEDLPKLVEALKKQDLEITVMASNVNRVDSLAEKVLRTAASLGVKSYRMENYRYDLKRPVVELAMSVPLYMDHHVKAAITDGLRRRGVDVLTCLEDGTFQSEFRTQVDTAIRSGAARRYGYSDD